MNAAEREKALLEVVENYQASECDRLRGEAQDAAKDLMRTARRQARRRVHAAVTKERERAMAQIRAAQAELDTRRRAHWQHVDWAFLRTAGEQLTAALLSRWRQADTRQSWIAAAVGRALTSLPPGAWTIRHSPDGWSEAEPDTVKDALAKRNAQRDLDFESDDSLQAGLIIASATTSLDASARGLLADETAVGARLLSLKGERDAS